MAIGHRRFLHQPNASWRTPAAGQPRMGAFSRSWSGPQPLSHEWECRTAATLVSTGWGGNLNVTGGAGRVRYRILKGGSSAPVKIKFVPLIFFWVGFVFFWVLEPNSAAICARKSREKCRNAANCIWAHSGSWAQKFSMVPVGGMPGPLEFFPY